MAELEDTTTLEYNGYRFSSHTSTKLAGQVVYDDSNRIAKYMRWTLSAHSFVTGAGLDLTMEELHIRLTKPAKRLIIQDKGMGDFDINGPGKVKDVTWGPHPKMISMSPLGGGQGVIFDWQIEFTIPHCDNARYQDVAALVYDVSWAIDQAGYTTRRISGSVEIAMTRKAGSNKVPDSADRFRAIIVPDLPLRFRRTQNYKLSTDRRTLSFDFTDTELPEALPFGVAEIEVEQTVSSQYQRSGSLMSAQGFVTWDIRFSGNATPAAGIPTNIGLDAIMQTIGKRLLYIRERKVPQPVGPNPIVNAINKGIEVALFGLGTPKLSLIPKTFSVSEQIYGKSVRVEASYLLLGSDITRFIADSGMFLPVGNSAKGWKENTYDEFIDKRGHARMKFVAGEEALIDLCTNPKTDTNTSEETTTLNAKVKEEIFSNAKVKIDPNASWTKYENNLRVVTENRIAKHKRIPVEIGPEQSDPKQKGPDAGKADAKTLRRDTNTELPGKLQSTGSRDVIQKLGAPSYRVLMSGVGIRLQHTPPAPRLLKIGGRDATQVDADIQTVDAGNLGDVKLVQTTWRVLYEIDGKPEGQLPSLANPQLGTDGGTA